MSIFDIYRKISGKPEDPNKLKIKFGFRGENLNYSFRGKEIEISFTWINGYRLYSEDIHKWKDGALLTEVEKETVFLDSVSFVRRHRGSIIVVINSDDPSRPLWERLCAADHTFVDHVEFTSDEKQFQFMRNMFLKTLKAGGCVINGKKVSNEQDLDQVMENFRKNRDV